MRDDLPKHLCKVGRKILSRLYGLSSKKKIMILILIWSLLFLPTTFHHSVSQKDDHYHYFPSEAAPKDFETPEWEIETKPETISGRSAPLNHNVSSGERVTFEWIWHKSKEGSPYVGTVNVIYEMETGNKKLIRLNEDYSSGTKEVWTGEKKFKKSGNISYYYRVEKGDIPVFQRRASIISEGGNPYEETRTGPPPLIHLFFIPPALLSAPIKFGGAFLSFNLYFALFLLLDSFLLHKCAAQIDEERAILPSLLFLANPLTVLAFHQDEPIIAFLMLLPLYLLLKNRKYLSTSVGIGMIAKVWTAFWIPVMVLLNREGLKKRIIHLAVSTSIAGGLLLFFRIIWGPKVLWFLSFYGGSASKSSPSGISFWALIGEMGGSSFVPPATLIIGALIFVELVVLYISWRNKWRDIYILVTLLAIFFALYPKMHWEYYLVFFPPLLFIGTRENRYLKLFYVVAISATFSMLFKQNISGTFSLAVSLLLSILLSSVLFLIVYLIYRDKGHRAVTKLESK